MQFRFDVVLYWGFGAEASIEAGVRVGIGLVQGMGGTVGLEGTWKHRVRFTLYHYAVFAHRA